MITAVDETADNVLRETDRDLHVMPLHGRPHESSAACWCHPLVTYRAAGGAQVWTHREEN